MSRPSPADAPSHTNYKWLIRHAIAQRTPLPVRKRIMSVYHRVFLMLDKFSDLVRLTWNGWGERPQIYFPYYLTHRHVVWKMYATFPPMRYTSYPLAELCHWVNHVPDPPRKPCVAECEHILALAGDITDWQHGLRNLDQINRLVGDRECRFVFTYSAGLMHHSRKYLHPDLWHKFGYIYACYPAQPEYERPPARPFTIFTIASRFSDKGVPEALQAFQILRERHGGDVRMILVSQSVPPDYPLPEGVIHYNTPRMSPELKTELFRIAHVLLIPCYSDSGVPILEACAYGVPTIFTRILHGAEVVKDGKTGFLLDVPISSYSEDYGVRWKSWEDFLADVDAMRARGDLQSVVDQAVDRLELMISGAVDVEEMGRAARQFHAENFTPEIRNDNLRKLYAAALAGETDFPL